jgi:hypothetical protein
MSFDERFLAGPPDPAALDAGRMSAESRFHFGCERNSDVVVSFVG